LYSGGDSNDKDDEQAVKIHMQKGKGFGVLKGEKAKQGMPEYREARRRQQLEEYALFCRP
jgi:hypothetical protein